VDQPLAPPPHARMSIINARCRGVARRATSRRCGPLPRSSFRVTSRVSLCCSLSVVGVIRVDTLSTPSVFHLGTVPIYDVHVANMMCRKEGGGEDLHEAYVYTDTLVIASLPTATIHADKGDGGATTRGGRRSSPVNHKNSNSRSFKRLAKKHVDVPKVARGEYKNPVGKTSPWTRPDCITVQERLKKVRKLACIGGNRWTKLMHMLLAIIHALRFMCVLHAPWYYDVLHDKLTHYS